MCYSVVCYYYHPCHYLNQLNQRVECIAAHLINYFILFYKIISMDSKEEAKNTSINNSNGIDHEKLQHFLGKIASDIGGALSAILVYTGDKLGLYKAMADYNKRCISSYNGLIQR